MSAGDARIMLALGLVLSLAPVVFASWWAGWSAAQFTFALVVWAPAVVLLLAALLYLRYVRRRRHREWLAEMRDLRP